MESIPVIVVPLPPLLAQQVDDTSRMQALVTQVAEVSPVSASVQRVMQLTAGDEVDSAKVVDAVAADPGLAAEVMRVANAPLYGQARRVNDLKQAVAILGLNELHQTAAAMGMLAAFQSREELSLQFHSASVLCGTVARRVARELRSNDKVAFVSGLLCEIGALACLSVDGPGYAELWNISLGRPNLRANLERRRYGATSGEIGARLLFRNHLPTEVALAVEASVDADPALLTDLARATLFARLVAPVLIRAAREKDPETLKNGLPGIADLLGIQIPKERLFELCVEAAAHAELGLRGEKGHLTVETSPPKEAAVQSAPEPEAPLVVPMTSFGSSVWILSSAVAAALAAGVYFLFG